ncbi:MAG TPA: tripartite tricarboxylate transporter substrate-binding protein, partial [Usitatibacter sp.]|nr:tripartite tricarboxylate transporter substrate-binding protein [Usitatibacter sp.]
PKDVLAKLEKAATDALKDAAVRERLTKAGAEPASTSAAEFGKVIAREQPIWAKVIRESGAKVD